MIEDPTNPSVFLERQSYRRNRLADAARLLPLIGAAVLSVPLLWPSADSAQVISGAEQAIPTSVAIRYIFGTWAGLIGVSVLFGLAVKRWGPSDSSSQSGPG